MIGLQLVSRGVFAITQVLQVGRKEGGDRFREAVDHPGPAPLRFDKPCGFEIGKLLGNFYLRGVQKGLQVADAKGTFFQ